MQIKKDDQQNSDIQHSNNANEHQPLLNYSGDNQTDHNSTNLEDRQKRLQRTQLKNRVKGGLGFMGFFVAAFAFALVINRFILQSYQVVGSSMSPTLEQDDWLIISKLGKTWSNTFSDEYLPKRGDVIVFNLPRSNDEKSLIKRVIALPGERVELADDGLRVFNNEFPDGFDPDLEYKDQLYQPDSDTINSYAQALNKGPLTVPNGEVFVAGDNRAPGQSLDSRGTLGTVPTEDITGVLKARLFPVGDIDLSF